jgi:hypothetical protein
MSDPAAHSALFAPDFATSLTSATTGHAYSSGGGRKKKRQASSEGGAADRRTTGFPTSEKGHSVPSLKGILGRCTRSLRESCVEGRPTDCSRNHDALIELGKQPRFGKRDCIAKVVKASSPASRKCWPGVVDPSLPRRCSPPESAEWAGAVSEPIDVDSDSVQHRKVEVCERSFAGEANVPAWGERAVSLAGE